ncbi:hypothetical protein POWCR01_080005900 [Plasmodium ovale]|uniref:PIR protein n=1 Tax=Plasmodium ovale TaxID=36330 RepID=A0A1C3KR17_PLAOA|nr:hypothetical protein POWCR01_080005900 [Plasmodium ovale]
MNDQINNIHEIAIYNNLYNIEAPENISINNYITSCNTYNPIDAKIPYIRNIAKNYNDNTNNLNDETYAKYCTFIKY